MGEVDVHEEHKETFCAMTWHVVLIFWMLVYDIYIYSLHVFCIVGREGGDRVVAEATRAPLRDAS